MVQTPTPQVDLVQLCNDIEQTAAGLALPYDRAAVDRIVNIYADRFSDAGVSFRTTNVPPEKRNLSVRYLDCHHAEDNPYAVALEQGLLTPSGHPIDNLFDEIADRVPLQGFGVDIGIRYGMEKIWSFFGTAVPVEALYEMPAMPPAIQNYDAYFRKQGLDRAILTAIDYRHKSMNVYFSSGGVPDFGPERVASMIADLGFKVPEQDADVLVGSPWAGVYLTFDWESERCLRLNFAQPFAPRAQFPMHLDPLFATMYDAMPVLTPEPKGCFIVAYMPDDQYYLKIEMDYNGLVDEVLLAVFRLVM